MPPVINGSIGLQIFGDDGLLRSLAVHASQRGGGIGRRLVTAVEKNASSAGVAEIAICPAPEPTWGEVVVAVVVADGPVNLNGLVEGSKTAGLAAHKHPVRLVIVEELPRTASGKIVKRQLREELAAKASAPE